LDARSGWEGAVRLDRFDVGFFLVLGGAAISLLTRTSSSVRFATTGEVLAWYAIGTGLSILVVLGAIMASRGDGRLGYPFVFVPSVLFLLCQFLFIAFPRPEGVAFVLYEAMASTGFLFFSLTGGIIMLATRSTGVAKPSQSAQGRFLTIPILTILLVSILLRIPSMQVGAYTWHVLQSGDTTVAINYGMPVETIAEYDAANQSLRVGVKVAEYASASAKGTMSVYAVAQSTEVVTATLRWYIRGASSSWVVGFADTSLIVKFIYYDLTADAGMEVTLLRDAAPWSDSGTWRETEMNVALYAGHLYRFSLFVSTFAGVTGYGFAGMDCGGASFPDSRVQWGYLDLPGATQAPSPDIQAQT
jgi:hypothetical protein